MSLWSTFEQVIEKQTTNNHPKIDINIRKYDNYMKKNIVYILWKWLQSNNSISSNGFHGIWRPLKNIQCQMWYIYVYRRVNNQSPPNPVHS